MKWFVRLSIFTLITALVMLSSCKKDNIFTSGEFTFSTDTLLFDTVFTTIGSTTRSFKIYNGNNNTLKFDEIRLMGGQSSPFRMNIDGEPGIALKDVLIGGKDSLFGFVDVTLNVNGGNYPMVYLDSIKFEANGKTKYLILAVWGQDVYIHNKDITEGIWPNDKPHLVFGYTAVDSSKSLIIQAGTQIYFHKNASFLVYKGSLDVQGQPGNEVVFQGDRLENFYKDIPGQWYGVRFIEAEPSTIEHAIIKNGQIGLQIDSTGTATDYTLSVHSTQIYNQSFFGVYPVAGARLKMENCVVNNAGIASAYLFAGGAYNFNQCTFANYNALNRNTPLFIMQNFFQNQGITYARPITEAIFRNSVFYGSLNDEFLIQLQGIPEDYLFDHCHIRNSVIQTGANFINCTWNTSPNFENTQENDFRFKLPSPLYNSANPATALPTDLLNNPRFIPDIGAYEFVE
jgi:hypothetical protein